MDIELNGNVIIRHQSVPDCEWCDKSKEFLDEKVLKYLHPKFIKDDPLSIPHRFNKKEDMNTILIILGILAIGAAVYFYFYKTGKINDRDGDYIPDEVEDAVEDVKEEVAEANAKVKKTVTKVKRRAKRVKEELSDVGDAIKEVGSQLKDVGQAAKGKKRSGRKPKK